jgi:uncharacterized protein YbjT (DUF2867 family)
MADASDALDRSMKLLIFGATGSAGASVLSVCLETPQVDEVRAIARRPPREHPKLRTFVHQDYRDFSAVSSAFAGVDACLYCLGISVSQVSGEAEYRLITHEFAIAAARALKAASPAAVFHFVSGQGARLDSRFMWARVKAETERDLSDLVQAVCWRPASIDGMPSQSEPRLYRAMRPVMRLLRPFRSLYIDGRDIGYAMLQATADGMRGRIVSNAEMRDLADRAAGFRRRTP